MTREEKKIIKKVNELFNFMSHLDQCSKKQFDRYCKRKEIKLTKRGRKWKLN